jgi:RNA polymerase sigma-70 factor (ECF subfamily)
MSDEDSALRTRLSLLLRLRQEPDNQAAWGEFVQRYGPQIYAWCRRWQLQPADAEDVTQTVLLKLATQLRTFVYDPGRRFRGLLKTIAHHAWSDFVTGQKRAVPGSGDSAVLAALHTVEARDDLAAQLEAAFDQELLALAQDRVRQRVEPRTWEAFRLTALEGRSGEEAAAQLQMRRGTVFQAKSKVQKMLREEIERLQSEEPPCSPVPAARSSSAS